MILFAIATICPLLLTLLAILAGGFWGWLALGYITVLVFVLDRLIAGQMGNADPEAEFPGADTLLISLGMSHFLLLGMALWGTVGPSGLGTLERASVALSAALIFGQISHPVAHELIHKPARILRLMGRLIYTSILFGHHASAHLRVHHVHVASKHDPSSARRGEGFYRFALRAWPGAFVAGLRAENRLRSGRRTRVWHHPYALYIGGAAGMVLVSISSFGMAGVVALMFMAFYTQLQILMSDYIQHYGLRRQVLSGGTLEPVGLRHSWNARHICSSAMTLNAPRHSDHHVRPMRPYPALQLDPNVMPLLPHSLPVMAVLALVPPLWRKIMDPRCDEWRPGWATRTTPCAGDISPAILALAKSDGLTGPVLPQSTHATVVSDPVPDGAPAGGPRRDAHDSGGI